MKKGDQKSQNSEKVKRKQKPLVQETINGLLNTAMNIELVYTILLGINTFMELMIKSQQEQQAQQQDTQNDQNNQELSEIQPAQETQLETKKELLKKTADYLYISQAKNTKKIGTHANYQIKQQDQAIKIKIMDVTMIDAQKFDVDQNFSDNNDSVLGQAFNQDYRLKDSLTRDQDKFNFPQDLIILDQSFSKSFEETNLVQSNSQIGNKLQKMVTGNFGSNQKNQDKRILNETPAFHPTLKFQQTKEPKFDHLQMPQNDSFTSSTQKLQQNDDDLNKISFDSEVIESPKKQMSFIRQFSGRSDFSNRKLENEKNGSFLQTMSELGQNLNIDYGDRNQNEDRSISQSFAIQQNLANKPKKQNLISKIMQLESREQFRLKETDFVEDIIFDPVEVTMKSGHNREVSLALRFRIPEVQKKESFYLPKVISVESRTNNQKKNFKNRNFSRQGRASIQDKFFHGQNFVLEEKYTLNQKSNGLKRQFSNRSLNQVQPSKSYSQTDSPSNSQMLNDSKVKFSQAKSQKEKTKMSINLKTDIVCLEPQKFAKIMEMDGINPQDVIKSLSISANYKQLFKAGEGSGQSGSFFFFSWDKKLLIKTLRGQEKKNLLKMLDEMIEYFEKVNNRSLLARIYGCFTIKSNYFPDLDVIVMQNATQLIAPKLSDIITFDLKGSTKGRKTRIQKGSEKFWKQKMSFKGTLKDLNLVEIMHDKGSAIIQISESQFDTLEYIIHRDSKFLRKHNLMDYSLLLTIEQVPCTKEQYDEQETQFQEKKKLKMDEIMHLKRLSGAALAQSILFNSPNDRKASSQNRKTQGQSTSIKDLLNARTIVDLREQSLRLQNFHFHTSEHRSSIVSGEINTQSNSKIKNSITSNQNNKSEYASELQSLRQEYKDNAQLRNFLKTQIIKEQVVKKEDLRKSHFIKNKLTQRDKLDKSQREDTFRYKKQQPDQKRKKTQKKLGESYRSQDEEDEVEYKYYRQVAHLAIIDYLQEWSIIKKMENALMRFTLSKQEINTISAVHPELYQSRFENFMVQQFLKPGREKFMSQEKKNYSETCDEFIMKLAYDIRMSELDKEKEQNLVKVQDDEQLQLSGEYDGQFKENQFNVSYEEIQYNLLKSKKQEVVMRQSKEFILPDSANDTPVSLRQNLESNESEVYRAQLTFGQNQYLIDDAESDDGQQK